MKQRKLVSKLYQACIRHDEKTIQELRATEFKKIAKRRAEGKSFDAKWTLVRIQYVSKYWDNTWTRPSNYHSVFAG